MRDKTRILFSFSELTPLTRPSPRMRGEGERSFVTFTQSGASLALGYFLTPLMGRVSRMDETLSRSKMVQSMLVTQT